MTSSKLKLGSNVVEILLPHRPPLLMVDTIEAYEREPRPSIRTSRYISANEDVFRGHFPTLHLWPGIYTQEGLGQTSNLLATLVALQKAWEEADNDPDEVLMELRNLEHSFQLYRGLRPSQSNKLVAQLKRIGSRVGMSGAVDIRFLHPVFGGQRLDYLAAMKQSFGETSRFEVEASVDGCRVAHGVITASWGTSMPGAGE